jgi:uncharacterized protein
MPIVSNTSPILSLSLVGLLELLQIQFTEVNIPSAVYDEFKLDLGYPGTNSISKAIDIGWLKVVQLKNNEVAKVLSIELDYGESEAIALTLEKKVNLILMDEQEGRSRAKQLGLKPIGIIGVILRAKKSGQISSVKEVMESLRKNAGFYIHRHNIWEQEIFRL